MSYGDVAGEVGEVFGLKGLTDQPHGDLRPYSLAVGRGDARAFLPSMLKRK